MAAAARHKSPDQALAATKRAQSDAADPEASVWVSANAGTGKTHVLTMRVLRLLLTGTQPERLLCLTFTKAAAAEMSTRVFSALGKWVTITGGELSVALEELLGRAPQGEEIARARTLFARAIETPGGLKVQTIHAFCERLLQRFPLEAGVPPGFAILDEATSRTLQREATATVLSEGAAAPAGPLGRALESAIAYAVDDRFDEVLQAALNERAFLGTATRIESGRHIDSLATIEALYRQAFGLREGRDQAIVEAELDQLISHADLQRLVAALAAGTATDRKFSELLSNALLSNSGAARQQALETYFITSEGGPRKSLLTRSLKASFPDLDILATNAQQRFIALTAELRGLGVIAATLALLRIASAVMQRYSDAKARRAALDFEDLIARTANLLATSENAQWVLYKLDGGLDHILVDESQDTSPVQWRIVEALASEFYSGAGARDGAARTLFAVGDEKQSIYSFQGAAPEMFAEKGRIFAGSAASAGAPWRAVPLELSFRSTAPVLQAADAVFASGIRAPGVAPAHGQIHHDAYRIGQAGLVEIWPTEAHATSTPGDVWSPLDEASMATPVSRLANRIADTVAGWLAKGERLVSENRPLRPGDILILLRKRRPFADPMVAALKARNIAVAGADRIHLTEQLGVQDLMALCAFLTLPEDDLSLATVLKSPLFGFGDDGLLDIANNRKGTLWSALLAGAKSKPEFREAAETLKRWRARADFTPPYEFLASVLDRDGMRQRLLARLGPEAADPIDEFMNLALTYDDRAPPSLAGFLTWLQETRREIKRDMEHGRDEVRIMTVHGAKGLEAPVVFLPDTCTTASGRSQGGLLSLTGLALPSGVPAPFVWCVKGSSRLAPIATAKSVTDQRDAEERNRLLYVAMTRARDRLYVAGFEGKKARPQNSWYDLITSGLEGLAQPAQDADGRTVIRLAAPQSAANEAPKSIRYDSLTPEPPPAWAHHPAPREPQLTIPLAPSRLAPYEYDDTGEPAAPLQPNPVSSEPPSPPPSSLLGDNRFLRGTLTHALLQYLPALPKADWRPAAEAFAALRGTALPPRTRAGIVAETLAVLNDASFTDLFGPNSRAEVPVAARIPRPSGRGPALRISGQIDRLAVLPGAVFIVDYKTNRPPPVVLNSVADAYIYQLAAYRLALAQVYPDKQVRAAILWTDGPRIMEIPDSLLDLYTSRLWDLDAASLDG